MTRDPRRRSFPDVITGLPEADIPFEGVRGWIVQGETHQLVFFEMEPTAEVPEHTHDYPQWGVVLEGEMELRIGGEAKVYGKGDDYVIPSGVMHSARFLSQARVMDFFSERSRYRTKKS